MYLSGINHLLYNVFKSVQNPIKSYVLLYQKRNNFTISQRKCSYPQNMHNHAKVASLVAQLVKNLPAMKETQVRFLGGKDPQERDRIPTPVFLGFPVAQLEKNQPAMGET